MSEPQRCETPTIFLNMSVHLTKLAAQVHAIEHELGKQLDADAPLQATSIIQLQNLDYLRQSLQDLVVLSLSLSKTECTGVLSEAEVSVMNQQLKLKDTRSILSRQIETSAPGPTVPAFGDLDIF